MKTPPLQKDIPCIHTSLVSDDVTGEKICSSCGQVLVQKTIDYSHDVFTDDFQNYRMGPKTTLTIHDRGLSTVIGKSNFDSKGNPVTYKLRGSLNRMRMWDSRSKLRSTSNRNLMIALMEIGKLKEKMSLSDTIVERSAYFYRKAIEKKLIRGRTVRGVVGACVYAACRDLGTTRTLIEISEHLQERRKTVAKSYRLLFQKLSLDVSIADPTSSIIRFANNLGLSERIKRDAILILDSLKEKKIVAGKKPGAVAATVIYMACVRNDKNVSQLKVSKISGITEVTIRNRFREFKKHVPLI